MRLVQVCSASAIASSIGIGIVATAADAASVIQQTGKRNPATNAFSVVTCCGTGANGVGKKDLGLPVWAMGGGDTGDQFGYLRALTPAQAKTVSKKGFVLTVVERVIQGSGPAYGATTPITIGDSDYDDGTVRWEIDVGVNSAGDPVVVLPNTLDNMGPGNTIQSHGAQYTLTGAGSSYNRYQLAVQSGSATLYVNGKQVLTGYTGNTSFVSGNGVVFTVNSGGKANYNLVGLTSTTILP